jgi:hypothetical protein
MKPMPTDFKKTDKALYQPKVVPSIVDVPAMTFLAVDGRGDPNTSAEYKTAVEILYGLSYAVKMSPKAGAAPIGYFDYVVPPLEGLWALPDGATIDPSDKASLNWTSLIRQPDFVTDAVVAWAMAVTARKKPNLQLSRARLVTIAEGRCVQAMHLGPYDDEPATVAAIDRYATEQGYALDFTESRRHHEIYLSDPRKTAPEKLRTVVRHPIKEVTYGKH